MKNNEMLKNDCSKLRHLIQYVTCIIIYFGTHVLNVKAIYYIR